MTGHMYPEGPARIAVVTIFVGFFFTFVPQFVLGYLGMPRRIGSYPGEWQALNVFSTAGATVMGAGYFFIGLYLVWSLRRGKKATSNPWNAAGLEWQTASPPITQNFPEIPVIDHEAYNYDEIDAPLRVRRQFSSGGGKARADPDHFPVVSVVKRKCPKQGESTMKFLSEKSMVVSAQWSSGPSPRPRLIFVVDDERTIASSVAAILQLHGFLARYFLDPLEALDAARGEAPDLLISDVSMPQLSGVDLAILIQKQCPACKILLFSGQATTADLLRVAREHGRDFRLLAKPIHPSDLLSEIVKADDSAEPDPNCEPPVRPKLRDVRHRVV